MYLWYLPGNVRQWSVVSIEFAWKGKAKERCIYSICLESKAMEHCIYDIYLAR